MCGNGVLEVGEQCEGSTDELVCYSDCSICCAEGACIVAKCCNVEQVDGFVPFDPECRNCGEVGEGCGATPLLEFGCCDDLNCWDLSSPDPRLLSGTCCRGPGSDCVVDGDCCGGNSFPWPSLADACVGGRCCVRTGSVCRQFGDLRGPCCDPAAVCEGATAVAGWNTCCVPGTGGVCCVERGGQCELFGQSLGPCCTPGDVCAGPGIGGGSTCCAPTGQACAGASDCCSGVCTPPGEGTGGICQ